ncbi:MAG: hypothetical protein HYW48_02825 [Deltaproteobacteria bacterium]|nr:hypothetical protein [Deltaproteobacteria bacterium]
MPYFPLISSLVLLALSGCRHSRNDSIDEKLSGLISYPFLPERPLGVNGKKEPFVIRSRMGATEYAIEIPDAGEEYDIEIPLAALQPDTDEARPQDLPPPTKTDRELVGTLPQVTAKHPDQAQLMDKAFGVGEIEGSKGGPSYVLGLAKIKSFYQKKQFEYALIAIDDMLSFYPNSPRLHKMKGTIFIHMNDLPLAERAWHKALELDPEDKTLRRSLARLRDRMKDQ